MSAFDTLHPALQHHVVNTLGWKTLRPLQEESIEVILQGNHALLLAPTAGGKTEAAAFPLISRLLTANWSGLSVLYLCPIKALLNSLYERLSGYCDLLGLQCALWHGDTSDSERRAILASPPQILLTTPESLEVMLISKRVDHRALFRAIHAVVVDELHAFAGDDRGWHLLSLIERIGKITEVDIQRIGLSATVGNPAEMLSWLAGSSRGEGTVVAPLACENEKTDVQLDYVGNLENAALVLSRLHRGEKRLVFCDSRARVESLAVMLRSHGVETFVSHSSLSASERRRAEDAFAAQRDCVIVATSTLELGIDVGNLDRVVQIDAPSTVSSFLQRLGRTGRRQGAVRNCLFLATHDNALVQGAGLLNLWGTGFVEPVQPPNTPGHIFAQQIMALALQENGIGRETYKDWLNPLPGFDGIPAEERDAILQYMLDSNVLTEDQGILWFDTEGEARFGYRNFMELCSVFTSSPLFSVLHGKTPIGFVHEASFLTEKENDCILLLGGLSWRVVHVNWQKKSAYVEPAKERGRSRWLGTGTVLSTELSEAMRNVLNGAESSTIWSKRAAQRLAELQDEYNWLPKQGTCISHSSRERRWWTFAGTKANFSLANALRNLLDMNATADALSLRLPDDFCKTAVRELADKCTSDDTCFLPLAELDHQMKNLKFSACLPPKVQRLVYQQCYLDIESARRILNEEIITVPLTR